MDNNKNYEEVVMLEDAVKKAPGWNCVQNKEKDGEITTMYYNSDIQKSIKIIKNNDTKYATIQDVPVKDLSNNKANTI